MISLLTDDMDHCFFCGRPADCEHHLIFGSANRELADEDCLKVPICNNCHTAGKVNSRIHDNPMAEKLSKMLGQMAYENGSDGKRTIPCKVWKKLFIAL